MLVSNAEYATNFSPCFSPYLAADYFADWQDPKVIEFTKAIVKGKSTPKEIAITLYHYIRDHFLYDPFQISFDKKNMRASEFLNKTSGHCIDKANLLIACARQQNIPARYRFANVRNHIGTEKLEAILKTDVLVFHGMAELYIDKKWIKITPAFNKELCTKLNVDPLDFNGKDHAVFQEYNKSGDTFMEYLYDHGSFSALPLAAIKKTFFDTYPHLRDKYHTY
jgi:transglutaminase-like putative cysteine protease